MEATPTKMEMEEDANIGLNPVFCGRNLFLGLIPLILIG